MKVLIDVNVILDLLLNRVPFAADSQAIWDLNYRGRIEGYIASTAATNLFYIARRIVGQSLALQGVRDCLAAFEVIAVDGDILKAAAQQPGNDFEDSVVIRCAVAAEMAAIVSRDLRGFTASPVPAKSPAELVALLPTNGS